MEVTREEVEHALGGKLDGVPEPSRHSNFKVYVDDRLVGKASVGHGWDRLDQKRLAKVAGQLYISARELYDIVRCSKDKNWLRQHLHDTGKL